MAASRSYIQLAVNSNGRNINKHTYVHTVRQSGHKSIPGLANDQTNTFDGHFFLAKQPLFPIRSDLDENLCCKSSATVVPFTVPVRDTSCLDIVFTLSSGRNASGVDKHRSLLSTYIHTCIVRQEYEERHGRLLARNDCFNHPTSIDTDIE